MKCIKIQGRFDKEGVYNVTAVQSMTDDSVQHDAWNTITNVLRFISDDSNVGFPYTFPFNF